MFCKALAKHFWSDVPTDAIEIHLYNAPSKTKRTWAEYVDRNNNYLHTCETIGEIGKKIKESANHIHNKINELSKHQDVEIMFCGISNGCVPAFQFTSMFQRNMNVCGCVLINGCPSIPESFLNSKEYNPLPVPILMCVANDDILWKEGRVLYKVAWRLQACVFTFVGKHKNLPDPTLVSNMLSALSKTDFRSFKVEGRDWDHLLEEEEIRTPEPGSISNRIENRAFLEHENIFLEADLDQSSL